MATIFGAALAIGLLWQFWYVTVPVLAVTVYVTLIIRARHRQDRQDRQDGRPDTGESEDQPDLH